MENRFEQKKEEFIATWTNSMDSDFHELFNQQLDDLLAAKKEEEIKICTGCGHRSDVKIKSPAYACCPDNNYILLDTYIKVNFLK